MFLVTVASDRGFHRDVLAALDGRLRMDAALDLDFVEAVRLGAVGPGDKCVLVLDFTEAARALETARAVNGRPQFAVIAVGVGDNPDDLVRLMRVGVRDVVPHFSYSEVLQAVSRAIARPAWAGEPLADVNAFVPAKPGCGATTVATYASALAAKLASEPTLLLDFDIRLGVTSFLLKTEGVHTVVDALLEAEHLDRDMLQQLVSQRGNLHLLGSGPVDFSRPLPADRFATVLDVAVQQYSMISVDLPGSMDDYECDVLLRSKRIFLVCTQDLGALHIARRKSNWLRELQLTDRVSVVLNCVERRNALSVADIERIIQLPVRYLLPSSPVEIAHAVRDGATVEGSSPLAKQLTIIAKELSVARPVAAKPGAMRRFVDYFSISATREVPAR